MSLQKFEFASLIDIDDGRIAVAFQQAMNRLQSDCRDRPTLTDARTLTLKMTMVPVVMEEDADTQHSKLLDSVDIRFQITDSVPKRTSRKYNMRAVGNGLAFNEASPEDVRQMTLDMANQNKPTVVADDNPEESEDEADVG